MDAKQMLEAQRQLLARFWYLHVIMDCFTNLRGKTIHDEKGLFFRALQEYPDMVKHINAMPGLPKFTTGMIGVNTLRTVKEVAERLDSGQKWTTTLRGNMSILLMNIEDYFLDLEVSPVNQDHHLDIEKIKDDGLGEANFNMEHY